MHISHPCRWHHNHARIITALVRCIHSFIWGMMIINCNLREAPIKGNPAVKIQILLERLASDPFASAPHACHFIRLNV